MPYVLKPTDDFLKQVRKLDNSVKELVNKKLERIKQAPALSKPLEHGSNIYSERVKGFRIVFKISGNEVILYRVKKRDEAYQP
ncbi:MAG: type II toxin-antitoxin system RelE/ParE family toxin [Candidatus Micrarchaeia archaeon]|jgi:mRNA-degrading endonuclease RelE of RelBE toxin-antitoxin system